MFLLNPYAFGSPIIPAGDSVYTGATADSTFQWTCPAGVTKVNALTIAAGGVGPGTGSGGGGGALAWKNNIPVTPGVQYTVFIGKIGTATNTASSKAGNTYFIDTSTCAAQGGQGSVAGQVLAGDGGGAGGTGAGSGGGGGAGGYSGAGGNGGSSHPGSGGGGGGGSTDGTHGYYSGGGGTGLYGEGTSGAGATAASPNGKGGSGGGNSTGGNVGGAGPGGVYGGGGGQGSHGGVGAVRLVWGTGRAFPSTLVDTSTA